ncbi:MAG: Hpt domain-containing protein, partial [Ruminiclostridium sp.]|nr:Hpt domain-containing protein [Ruminiclostridium sp.]
FITEGMNDFVAKPIDVKDINAKLKMWLPQEKIIPISAEETAKKNAKTDNTVRRSVSEITFLNTAEALELLRTENLFWTVLKEYYLSIDKKAFSIEQHLESKEWKEYTIEVHALKSTSRQVGGDELADLAAELENAGKNMDIDFIEANTGKAMAMYRELREKLIPFFPDIKEEDTAKKNVKPPEIVEILNELDQAIDDFDTLVIDEVIEKLSQYKFDKIFFRFFRQLTEAAEIGDIDTCGEISRQWKEEIVKIYTEKS